MTLRRILFAVFVLALGALAVYAADRRAVSTIVVRYMEPPARGPGRLALTSCAVRVEDAGGEVLARRIVPANPKGRALRSVRIELPRSQVSSVRSVLADCTDAAGRKGQSAAYAMAPARTPLTRVASDKP